MCQSLLQDLLKLDKDDPSLQSGNGSHLHVVPASDIDDRGAYSIQNRRLHGEGQATIGQDAQQVPQSRERPRGSDVSAGAVFVLTILMASASCLGAVPFFFVGTLSTRWSALANAIACGVMLAASFDLVHEGEPYGAGLVIIGITIGEGSIACIAPSTGMRCLVCPKVRQVALQSSDWWG